MGLPPEHARAELERREPLHGLGQRRVDRNDLHVVQDAAGRGADRARASSPSPTPSTAGRSCGATRETPPVVAAVTRFIAPQQSTFRFALGFGGLCDALIATVAGSRLLDVGV